MRYFARQAIHIKTITSFHWFALIPAHTKSAAIPITIIDTESKSYIREDAKVTLITIYFVDTIYTTCTIKNNTMNFPMKFLLVLVSLQSEFVLGKASPILEENDANADIPLIEITEGRNDKRSLRPEPRNVDSNLSSSEKFASFLIPSSENTTTSMVLISAELPAGALDDDGGTDDDSDTDDDMTLSPTEFPTVNADSNDSGNIIVEFEPACSGSSPNECGCEEVNQSDYRGSVSITTNGHTCKEWTIGKSWPGYGLDNNNHCRNPNQSAERVWCFVDEPSVRWDFCDVPICSAQTQQPTAAPSNAQTPSPTSRPTTPVSQIYILFLKALIK